MQNFNIVYKYSNGVMIEKSKIPQNVIDAGEIIQAVSVVDGIEFASGQPAYQNRINGFIYLECKDSKLYIKYDITPLQAISQIEQAIERMYIVHRP